MRLPALIVGAACASALVSLAAVALAGDDGYGVESITLGVLAHDVGAFGRSAEPGTDFNVEIKFDELTGSVWDALLNPQPHLGASLNGSGATSQIYVGMTWLFDFGYGFFGGGSLGGAVHNGETEAFERDEKSLGSSILFRESVELGFRFAARHSVSVMLDHISNAGLAKYNEGLDNFGVRYALGL